MAGCCISHQWRTRKLSNLILAKILFGLVLGKNLQKDLHLPFFYILQLLIGTLSNIQLYIGSQSRVFNMSESAPALTGWINEGW